MPTNDVAPKYKLKRDTKGNYHLGYQCPTCLTALDSAIEEAGLTIPCPACGKGLIVPGKSERIRLAQEQQAAAALEKRLIEAEQAKAAAEVAAAQAERAAMEMKSNGTRPAPSSAPVQALKPAPRAAAMDYASPQSMQRAPSYPCLQGACRILMIFGLLSCVAGLAALAWGIYIASTQTRSPISAGPTVISFGLGAILYGIFTIAIGEAGLALRDIARNSFGK